MKDKHAYEKVVAVA